MVANSIRLESLQTIDNGLLIADIGTIYLVVLVVHGLHCKWFLELWILVNR